METLKPHHEQAVGEYLRFSRYKRLECLRCVTSYYESLVESQLVDDAPLTTSEVREMLDGMWSAVKSDVETELISSAHLSALLLQQLLQQADEVHLRMKVNVAELENKELLEGMAAYEQQLMADKSNGSMSSTKTKLQPINFGGDDLLKKEIDRLSSENKKLMDRTKHLESKASTILHDNERLKHELSQMSLRNTVSSNEEGELSKLREQVSALQLQLSESGATVRGEKNLQETTEQLLKVSSELERTKAELERKFKETAQFQTMKKMLDTKNKQIAELREKLK